MVREKAGDVRMFSHTIINKRLKALLIIGRMLTEWFFGSDLSPSFLKTGATNEDFQQEGKEDLAKYLLYILARTWESSEEHIFRTMAGILSGPVALDASKS